MFAATIFASGFIVFALLWLYESFETIKEQITSWGFRITADNEVEHEFTQKKMEEIVRRVVREELSNVIIKRMEDYGTQSKNNRKE